MRGHGPQEADFVSRDGDVGMISARHQNGIAIAHHGHQFGIFGVVIYELDPERRIGHIEIHVHLFQHFRVLMGRPTGPIAGIGECKSGYDSSGSNVLGQRHV